MYVAYWTRSSIVSLEEPLHLLMSHVLVSFIKYLIGVTGTPDTESCRQFQLQIIKLLFRLLTGIYSHTSSMGMVIYCYPQ